MLKQRTRQMSLLLIMITVVTVSGELYFNPISTGGGGGGGFRHVGEFIAITFVWLKIWR